MSAASYGWIGATRTSIVKRPVMATIKRMGRPYARELCGPLRLCQNFVRGSREFSVSLTDEHGIAALAVGRAEANQ